MTENDIAFLKATAGLLRNGRWDSIRNASQATARELDRIADEAEDVARFKRVVDKRVSKD